MSPLYGSACYHLLHLKGTSPEIQTELIEVITAVLNEKIQSEIKEASFVSVQTDETDRTEVSCKSQMSIIHRYCIGDRIEERFVALCDIPKDKTAKDLTEVIKKVLDDWNVAEKVVSQTYDGALVMAG